MAKRVWFWGLLASIGVLGWWWWRQSHPPVSAALRGWQDIVAVAQAPAGLDWVPVTELPAVRDALEGRDPERVREAMHAANLRGLWVEVEPAAGSDPDLPLVKRLAAGAIVRGFAGALLTSKGLLYVIDETTWPVVLCDRVLARAARQILEGSEPPPIQAFPASLNQPQAIEVLVMLTGGRGPRLWRSARAESIAEGLVTAALAARKRWEERAETMGGPLGERLDQLDVQVAFLFDDGTFDTSAVSLIDALVKPRHGVAYEQPTRWRYLLPRATHNAASPVDAYRRLFRDNGLPEDSFDRRDLRLYRMRMHTVSVHQGSAASSRGGASSLSD